MAVLPIRAYPDTILTAPASPVTQIDGGLQALIDDMAETLYAAPGIGLAAPQVGRSLCLFVYDLGTVDGPPGLVTILNPEVETREGKAADEEGCLSIPDYRTTIHRAARVVVRGLDRDGKEFMVEGTDLLARVLQHELDHLEGLLIIDRLSSIKRDFFLRWHRKRRAKG